MSPINIIEVHESICWILQPLTLLSTEVVFGAPVFFAVLNTTFCLSSAGVISNWTDESRIPPCTIYQTFKYFLDITTPPSPLLLQQFAPLATNEKQRKRLEVLSKVGGKRAQNPDLHQVVCTIRTTQSRSSSTCSHSSVSQNLVQGSCLFFRFQPNLSALLISLMHSSPLSDTSSAWS